MNSLAQVIPIRPVVPEEGRRVADLDDGYTRTANELMEAVMLSGLTQHQLLIVMAVWRKTYGYNKKMDWISNAQFAELTGIAETKCSSTKNELIRMGVLVQCGRQVGMNKAVSEWKTKFNGFNKSFTRSINKTFTESVNSVLPNQVNTKDNITKDNITKDKKDNTPLPPTGVSALAEKKSSRSKPIPYQMVLDAYNSLADGKLPLAESLNEKRKRAIRRLMAELREPTIEAATAYFEAFFSGAGQFYFGGNDRGWRANFDYLLRSDTLVKTREGAL